MGPFEKMRAKIMIKDLIDKLENDDPANIFNPKAWEAEEECSLYIETLIANLKTAIESIDEGLK